MKKYQYICDRLCPIRGTYKEIKNGRLVCSIICGDRNHRLECCYFCKNKLGGCLEGDKLSIPFFNSIKQLENYALLEILSGNVRK